MPVRSLWLQWTCCVLQASVWMIGHGCNSKDKKFNKKQKEADEYFYIVLKSFLHRSYIVLKSQWSLQIQKQWTTSATTKDKTHAMEFFDFDLVKMRTKIKTLQKTGWFLCHHCLNVTLCNSWQGGCSKPRVVTHPVCKKKTI